MSFRLTHAEAAATRSRSTNLRPVRSEPPLSGVRCRTHIFEVQKPALEIGGSKSYPDRIAEEQRSPLPSLASWYQMASI